MNDIAHAEKSDLHVEESDIDIRQTILRCLVKLPALMNIASEFSSKDAFRVVMSEENAHLFKQGIDGFYKPYLHDGKQFVENVNLSPIGPDYFGIITNAALIISLRAISVKLDRIEIGVQNIENLITDTQWGRMKGALDGLAIAKKFADHTDRRREILGACQKIIVEFGALSGQLRAHITAMPKETTQWFDGLFNNGFKEAAIAFNKVKEDIRLLSHCINVLLRTYSDLNEPAVTKEAISRIVDSLQNVGLSEAFRKARLLPASKDGYQPEQYIRSFQDIVSQLDAGPWRVHASEPVYISMDVQPEELMFWKMNTENVYAVKS